MIRNSRRVVALAIAGAFVIAPAVSGCGAGTNAQTAMPTQLTEGVNASTESGIMIRNLFVLGPGAGQPAGLQPGDAAPVYGAIINGSKDKQADKLIAVTSPAFRQGARLTGGGITLPLDQLVSLSSSPKPAPAPGATAGATDTSTGGATPPQAAPTGKTTGAPTAKATSAPEGGSSAIAASGPPVLLSGLTKRLTGGETIEVVLQFQRGGSITLQVPVVPRKGEFETYAPAPGTTTAPPASPTAGATPAEGATPPHSEATPGAGAAGTPAAPGH